MRKAILCAVCLMGLCTLVAAQDIDIGATLKPSFQDLALLPTRLTAYNQHDDAATASYTCCKLRQEREIKLAIAANEAFLHRFGDTAFADFTLIHYGWVASFLPDAFRNREWAYRTLLEQYPDSHLADDAAYHLGGMYGRVGERDRAIKVYEFLVEKWPGSGWADHALNALVKLYNEVERPDLALDALNHLAYNYPKSEFCPRALHQLALKYVEYEDYQSAIAALEDLIADFPYHCLADDAQWEIAQCLRRAGDLHGALAAYRRLINDWYGSDFANRAMLEANNLVRSIRGTGRADVGEMYDTQSWNPAKEARTLWEEAKYLQEYGKHSAAVVKFREFIDKFPGNDRWPKAWYEIGQSYMRQDMLFQNINRAGGPDDIAKFRDDYIDSTGDMAAVPTHGKLNSLDNAREAFAYIVNNLKGACNQVDALGQVARCFIPYGDIETAVPPDAAYTFQEMVIHFPTASTRCPWFTDATWPVYAFCRLMNFYANAKNWDIAREMYPVLAREYPDVFPLGLESDRDAFYELMKLYALKTDHAYAEMGHHIPYGMSPSDLLPEAHYFQAGMLMAQGNYARAAELLRPLTQMIGHGLVAPATYLYGQANVKLGRWDVARAAFTAIVEEHPNSGLADDAQIAWAQYQNAAGNPAAYDLTAPARRVAEAFGIVPANMDVFIGERVVVFAPFTRAALMRQYNMPNIWDESQRVLRDWAGLPDEDRTVVVVDRGCQTTFGSPFKVAGCQIKDPPNWSIGLAQIAANVLAEGIPQLAGDRPLMDGIGRFVAASLQYDLVTETRDAIGSAEAVKLPQEEVIRARDRALKALEDYVIAGEDATLTPDVIAGMMYSMLDAAGFTRDRLIDREPYRAFFARLKEMPAETKVTEAFAVAATTAFGDGCSQQLKDWRLPLPATAEGGGVQLGQVR